MNLFLKAINKNHNLKNYSDYNNLYDIFNVSMEEYYIVLDKKIDANELYRKLLSFLSKQNNKSFNVDLSSFINIIDSNDIETILYVIVNAIEYSNNNFAWTQNKKILENKLSHKLININNKYNNLIDEIQNVANARTFARKLQDTPSNLMKPNDFVVQMEKLFKNENVKITVLSKQDLLDKKMNLILAVGQGATNLADEPKLMVIEYLNNKDSNDIYGFVGKGVCFDSGGYNLKPGNHMRWMKYDMSGAAIVGSALYAIVKNKLKINAIAVMPLVVNLIGSNALKPDDVIMSYSNKSVEIDNTDAEGRLILADALSYAIKDLNINKIFNIATLTGAMTYALGDTYTGVWSTYDESWNNILNCANSVGELVWRLPFHHDFKDLLKSKYADIANSVSDPRGGSSRAAMFLKEFVNNDTDFNHFDIAATGDANNKGTGIMINTFYKIAKMHSK